jgi:hypothetical protein
LTDCSVNVCGARLADQWLWASWPGGKHGRYGQCPVLSTERLSTERLSTERLSTERLSTPAHAN